MSKQEDITRIIDALATRGIECNDGAAYYLRNRHEALNVSAPIGYLSSEEICGYLIGHSTCAKAPEWHAITDGAPGGSDPVLWTDGRDIGYGTGMATSTHWLRIPALPNPERKCKLCSTTSDMYDRLGVCLCCIDAGPVGSRIPFEALEHHGVIITGGNPEPYDEAYRAMRKTMGVADTMDILLDLWESQ